MMAMLILIFFLNDGGELGRSHLEAAVTCDDPDLLVGAGGLCADGGGQCEAHGAEAARSDERARMLVVEVLRLPHLVLAHVGDHNCVASGDAPDVVNDVRGVKVAVVGKVLNIAHRGVPFERMNRAQPRRPLFSLTLRDDARQQFLQHLAQIADQRHIDGHVLVDF